MNESNNPPVKKFTAKTRTGVVQATIWCNETDNGTFHSVSLERRYKDDKADEWKSTNSYGAQDLAPLKLVADKAFEFVVLLEEQANA